MMQYFIYSKQTGEEEMFLDLDWNAGHRQQSNGFSIVQLPLETFHEH